MAIKDNRTKGEEELPIQVMDPNQFVPEVPSDEAPDDDTTPEETSPPIPDEGKGGEDDLNGDEPDVAGDSEDGAIPDTDEDQPDEEDEGQSDSDDGDVPTVNYKGVVEHFDQQGALSLDDGFETDIDPNDPEYFQEAINYTVNKKLDQFKKSFSDPISQKFLDYLENGGDPAKFIEVHSKRDYSKITNEEIENSTALQRMLVEEEMRAAGDDEETIREMVEIYEERGVLEAEARRAQKKGTARQAREKEDLVEQQKQAKIAYQQRREEFVSNLTEDINKRESIGGFALTPKSKRQFIDFMTKVDKEGATQLQRNANDPEKQLLMAYLYFIDFDFSTLSKEASTKAAEKLRENLGNFTDQRGSGKPKAKPTPRKKSGGYDKDVLKSLAGL